MDLSKDGFVSKAPDQNIPLNKFPVILLIVCSVTSPFFIAFINFLPYQRSLGISISKPAFAELAVECVPDQSDKTNPLKPQSSRNILFNKKGFSQL